MKSAATRKPSAARAAAALAVVLCALALALGTAWAADDGDETESEWTELTNELVINNAGTLSAGNYYLSGDVTLTTYNITLSGETTLDLQGHTLKDSDAGTSTIKVPSGASLTLTDSSSDGAGTIDSNSGGRALQVSGGSFTMEGGTITNGSTTGYGGGVYVSSSGTFTMEGGTISGNSGGNGGGVNVNAGTFTMNGGTISGNTASNASYGGGGGVYVLSGTFTMNGGTISGNTATAYGGGVFIASSGFFYVTSSSSVITGNEDSESYNSDDIFLQSGATRSITAIAGTWYGGTSATSTSEVTMTSLGGSSSVYYLYSEVDSTEYTEYTIIYDANADGDESVSGVPASQTAAYDEVVTLSSDTPTRTGYTFAGWNTASDGSGTSYVAGATATNLATDAESVTLYAQWVADGYTIIYDANADGDGSVSGVPASQTAAYDEVVTLSSDTPTRTGYTFAGWNTASDGSGTSYGAGATVANLAATDAESVTLYAQWTTTTSNTYTVTYDDGMTAFALFTTYSVEVEFGEPIPAFKYDTPEFYDFTFMGWTITVDGTTLDGIYEDPTTITVTGDTTLTATFGRTVDDFKDQSYTYDGQEQEFDLSSSSLSGFSVSYYSDEGCTMELEGYPTTVGTYYVKITREASDIETASKRYAAFEQVATLTIEPATLTASYSLETITYGETPELEVTVTGFVNDETAETASGYTAPTITLSDDDLDVGTHTLTPSGGEADNYSFNYVSADLVVTSATIKFEIVDNYWNYDGTAHSSTVNVLASSIVNSTDTFTITYSTTGEDGSYTTESPSYTDAGTYWIYFKIEADNYYTVTGSYNFQISEVTPTLKMSKATVTYTGEPQTLTASLAGVSGGGAPSGTISYSYTDSSGNVLDEAPTDVGTYTVTATYTPGEDDNYATTSTSAKLVIEPATLTATYAGEIITYGETPELEVTVTGFVNGETAETASGYTAPTITLSDDDLDVGTHTLTPSGGEADNYSFNYVSGTLVINKATPTVSVSVADSDDEDSTITYGEDYSVSAEVKGVDGVDITSSDLLTYTYYSDEACTNALDNAPVDAGTYWVVATYTGSDNYAQASSEAVEFTIAIATMEVSADNYEGVYDGAAHGITVTAPEGATITYATSEGGEYSEEPITYTDVCDAQTVYYQVSMDNYEAASGSATVTITKATPTVKAEDVDATYDGSSHTVTYTVTGVDSELDEATCTITYVDADSNAVDAPVNAGTYTATVSYAGSDNYNSASTTATVTIAKATPTVSASVVEVTYDGESHPVTEYAVTGIDDTTLTLEDGDISIAYSYEKDGESVALDDAPVNAGIYHAVVTYAGSDNYESASKEVYVIIHKATIQFAITDQVWTYDGESHCLNVASVDPSSGVTVTYSTDGENFSEESPSYTKSGKYNIYFRIDAGDNYNSIGFDASAIAVLTIKNAIPTLEAFSATYSYDGEAHGVEYTLSGVGSELDDAEVEIVYTYVDEDGEDAVLDGEPTDPGTYTATVTYNDKTGNYETVSDTARIVIQEADIEFSVVPDDAVYDGKSHGVTITAPEGATTSVVYSYVDENGETVVLDGEPVDVGEYTADFTITLNGHSDVVGSTTVVISKATPTVTVDGVGASYDGEGHAVTSYKVTGAGGEALELGDGDISISYTDEDGNVLDGAPTAVGTYTATVTYAGSDNYESASGSATVIIYSLDSSISLVAVDSDDDGTTITYGEDYSIEATVYDAEGNAIEGAEVELSYSCTDEDGNKVLLAEAPVDAGTYTVTATYAGSDVYNSSSAQATFTIEKAVPTVTASDLSAVYDGEGHAVTGYTVTGVDGEAIEADDDDISISYSYEEDGETVALEGEPVEVGTYTATVTWAGSDNYESASGTATVTISKAVPTVTVSDVSAVYDGEAHPVAEYTVTGADGEAIEADADDITITYVDADGSTLSGEPVDAGTYTATVTWAGDDSHRSATGTATVTISKAEPTLTALDLVVTYDGEEHEVSWSLKGIDEELDETKVAVSYTDEDGNVLDGAPTAVGTYTATVTYAGSANYLAASAEATVVIVESDFTFHVEGWEGTYDGDSHGATIEAPEDATVSIVYTDEDGNVLDSEPVDVGSYIATFTISLEGCSDVSGTTSIVISKASQDLAFASEALSAHVSDETAEDNALSGVQEDAEVSYESSNTSVATVDSDGTVSIVGAGETTITATTAETDNYTETTASYTLTVTDHDYEGVVTEPTCTEGGYTTYTCTICGDSYVSDETEATGHTEAEAVTENEVEATCTEDGSYDSVVYCSVCGEEISRETVTVEATGHSYESVVTDPTCTEGGYTTYTCSVCGDSYTDDETEATGHDWDYDYVYWVWTETDDDWDVSASVKCDNDASHVLEATDVVVESETVDATCNDDGSVVWTATATFGEGEDAPTATDVLTTAVSATGHDYDYTSAEFMWTEAEDGTVSCQAIVSCVEGDDSILVDADVEATSSVEASCEEDGSVTYTATITDDEGNSYTNDHVVAVPATGHSYDYDDVTWTWSDDNNAATVEATCTACGATISADAELSYEVNDDGTCTITATAELDGHEYTDSKEVSKFLFTDVEDADRYYFEAVYALFYDGIITGYSDGSYGVGDKLTRGQFATILWRIAGEPEASSSAGYSDVSSSSYYADAIDWAAEEGVFLGYSDGSFGPDDPITFEQMCVVIARYVCGGEDALDASIAESDAAEVIAVFDDADEVSSWAEKGMAWCVENELVMGNEDGSLDPLSKVSRERAATVVWRALEDGILS